jgi:hypothetical protein
LKSTELFWNVIALYHERNFAFELLMIVFGIVITVLLYRKHTRLTNASMKVYLAISFGWMAVVFFWGFDRSPLSMFFAGPLFLLIALLFLVDLFLNKMDFVLPPGGWQRIATFGLFTFVLIYPLVSLLLGHKYPRLSTPYLPCPLTVFALTLLSASLPRVDIKVYILLLIWSMMALPKIFGLFDVREDTLLFVAGVYGLVRLVNSWRNTKRLYRLEGGLHMHFWLD